jgi:hypothetical protein
MNQWLTRLWIALVLLGCAACSGPHTKATAPPPGASDKLDKPPAPPPIPPAPPKDFKPPR